jgi:hypothetical protein
VALVLDAAHDYLVEQYGSSPLKHPIDRARIMAAIDAPDVAELVEALRNCVGLLDGLVAESARSIEWGEEDPFRMGEWFEADDLAQIERARTLAKIGGQ